MRRALRLVAAAAVLAAVATVTAVAPAATSRAKSAASLTCARGLATVEADPGGLLPLTARSLGPATGAALLFLGRSVTPQAATAHIATVGSERRLAARLGCGAAVLARTIVVRLHLCAALPAKVYYVGRFQTGYRVWRVVR
jgi:hypothetical protein